MSPLPHTSTSIAKPFGGHNLEPEVCLKIDSFHHPQRVSKNTTSATLLSWRPMKSEIAAGPNCFLTLCNDVLRMCNIAILLERLWPGTVTHREVRCLVGKRRPR